MEKEIWIDVLNYDGLYKISNLGAVMSVERIVNNSNKSKRVIKSRILKICKSDRYCSVNLSKNNKARTFRIHQLMAVSFLGYIQKNRFTAINHIDGNKLNNNIANLEIVTTRENTSICKRNIIKKSGLPVGVHINGKKYRAIIYMNGKNTILGTYSTIEEASSVYLNKAREMNLIALMQ